MHVLRDAVPSLAYTAAESSPLTHLSAIAEGVSTCHEARLTFVPQPGAAAGLSLVPGIPLPRSQLQASRHHSQITPCS